MQTFNILQRVLVRMIEDNEVPSKAALNNMLSAHRSQPICERAILIVDDRGINVDRPLLAGHCLMQLAYAPGPHKARFGGTRPVAVVRPTLANHRFTAKAEVGMLECRRLSPDVSSTT